MNETTPEQLACAQKMIDTMDWALVQIREKMGKARMDAVEDRTAPYRVAMLSRLVMSNPAVMLCATEAGYMFTCGYLLCLAEQEELLALPTLEMPK